RGSLMRGCSTTAAAENGRSTDHKANEAYRSSWWEAHNARPVLRRLARSLRLASLGGAVVLSTLVVAAWPVADGQAQTSANQATPRRAAAPTAPAGGETTQPAGRQILPVIRQDVPTTPSTPTPVPRPLTDMAVGAGVIDNNYEMVRDMGFPWVKLNVDWAARPD